jgi:argininosuccinate lyase
VAKDANSNSIDLADWLVKKLDKPFRKAHSISGEMVKLAEKQNVSLEELSLDDMQKIEPAINEGVFDVLNISTALNARNSFGATAPKNVRKACTQARRKYLK